MDHPSDRLFTINVKKTHDSYSIHKPLLLLFALSRCLRGEPRTALFRLYDDALNSAWDCGPTLQTQFPFARLVGDGVWEIAGGRDLSTTSSGDLFRSELIAQDIQGGLSKDIYDELSKDRERIATIANALLERYIPSERHADIIRAFGLQAATCGAPGLQGSLDWGTHMPQEQLALGIRESSTKADFRETGHPNSYIAYLASLHNVESSGSNTLAESQALSPYYGAVYQPLPLVDDLLAALSDGTERVLILTGHAGDGKSSAALDVMKRIRGLDAKEPLAAAWEAREDCAGPAGPVVIVKDMSELGAEVRLGYLREAFEAPGGWLIVSNTGPLLSSLNAYAVEQGRGDVESELLGLMDRPYDAGSLDAHRFSGFRKELVIINMTRIDNVRLGAGVLTRLVDHPAWADCSGCAIESVCPLLRNRQALRAAAPVPEERVRWVYQRVTAYEQRLTMRQMVAQLAFALTGGMTCGQVRQEIAAPSQTGADSALLLFARLVFSEAFFGCRAGAPHPEASRLRAIALVQRVTFGGPVAVDFERRLIAADGQGWAQLPSAVLDLSAFWRERAREAAGVRRRFALRRLNYLFGTAQPDRGRESERFLNTFLHSPSLRDFDAWQQAGALTLTRSELNRLRATCLQVLLEFYSGFSAGQFGSLRDRLYLTLRRPDQAVVQPTQLVVATLDYRDFDIDYCRRRGLPVLRYERRDATAELPLGLPLLDYIRRREAGEIGNALSPVHVAQLEWFRGELIRVTADDRHDEDEIELLRAGIKGNIEKHRCQFDERSGVLEYL